VTEPLKLTRREFLIGSAAAGGLLLGFHLPPGGRLAAALVGPASGDRPVEVNAWIVIQPDDAVVIRVARSEMGQGIFTSLPMLIAEELDCDWSRVRAEYALAGDNLRRGNVFRSMHTGGSQSVRGSQDYLRKAGAVARALLLAAAARHWGVPIGECRAENSVIRHVPGGRTLTFGAVAAAAATLVPPETVTLKDPAEWRLLGKPVARLDLPDKIAGKPVFGVDVEVPGMLHAAIRACPVFGGRLKSDDADAVRERPGVVQVVTMEDAVAVVAESWWQAHQALIALPLTWDEAGHGRVDDAQIRADLVAGLEIDDGATLRGRGDPEHAFAGAEQRVEATLFAPYLAHATMEPMNCTAAVHGDGRVEVWAPTQNATSALKAAARAAGVDPLKVEMHNTQLGGGFGRRETPHDFVVQAVRIAKAVGRPVKLIWSREEDMQHDFYRPASMARLEAALDREGRLIGMTVRVSAPSILTSLGLKAADDQDPSALEGLEAPFYAIPHYRAGYVERSLHVPAGFWRSVNYSQNTWFREHFLDRVARAAGADPYRFRLGLLKDAPRQRAVLQAAAEAAGWGTPLPEHTFRGIAVETARGSHCAQVVELTMEGKDRFRLQRIVCAIDPGHVVNPDTIAAQVESAIVYGLTAALFGEIHIHEGRVRQGNFHDYPMLLLRHMPKVETRIVASGDFWGGVGEPPLPPAAPALCNALYAATSTPIDALPLSARGLNPV